MDFVRKVELKHYTFKQQNEIKMQTEKLRKQDEDKNTINIEPE